jgi:hypothetical protein
MSEVGSVCELCKIGYHAPFDRFEQFAVILDGPAFLKKCNVCGTLWHETLRSAERVSAVEASVLYPNFKF